MHQSGHSRAQSMQTVQFSSSSAMTPRLRGGSSGLTSGYCSVTERLVIVRSVTARPLASPAPGIFTTTTTATTPVRASWTSASGTSPCQASRCSWSSRSRG